MREINTSSLAAEEILFVRAEHVYCSIHLQNARRLLQRCSLTSLAASLPQDRFLRVHRSYLINLARVDHWSRLAVFVGGHCIPLSRSSWRQVVARLEARQM